MCFSGGNYKKDIWIDFCVSRALEEEEYINENKDMFKCLAVPESFISMRSKPIHEDIVENPYRYVAGNPLPLKAKIDAFLELMKFDPKSLL